jgi:hypothetical protein
VCQIVLKRNKVSYKKDKFIKSLPFWSLNIGKIVMNIKTLLDKDPESKYSDEHNTKKNASHI